MRQTGKKTGATDSTEADGAANGSTDSGQISQDSSAFLSFFPDQEVEESRVRKILSQDSAEEKAWVISHLLQYAQWDHIWTYVSRDEVREIFPSLELPGKLGLAWARILKIETPAS